MNKRRSFLKNVTKVAAASAIGVAATSCSTEKNKESSNLDVNSSAKSYMWKMTTTWPPKFPILGEGPEMFAELVEKMSAGRMKIKVYGAGELVPSAAAFEAVSEGAIEMAHSCPYYWAGKFPASQFFASVPFGMNGQQMSAWIRSGGGLKLWEELYAKANLIPMIGGNTGVQMGGWFNKKIDTIEDFKGLKMRMPGLGAKVLAKTGASAVSVAGGEIYTNLERGVIDATEWVGPYHDYKMGFHRVAKYYYYPGWHETGTLLEFIFNKQKFEELPIDLQLIMRSAADYVSNWVFSEFDKKNAEFLEKTQLLT